MNKLFPFRIIAMLGVIGGGIIDVPVVPIFEKLYLLSSQQVGPFYPYMDDVVLNCTFISKKNLRDVYYKVTCKTKGTSRNNIKTYPQRSYARNEKYKITITLPTKSYMNDQGCEVNILFRNEDEILIDLKIDMNVVIDDNTMVINPLTCDGGVYKYLPHSFKLAESSVIYSYDYYEFENFFDYFLIDEYYRLKIDQYKVTYQLISGFSYGYCYLELVNPKPCFSSLINQYGNAIIPLKIKELSFKEFSLEFATEFYVEPASLQISTTPKIGYKKTKYFYLPFNKKEEVSQQEFRFHLDGMGRYETSIEWSVYLSESVNLIGECGYSKYCVTGGVLA